MLVSNPFDLFFLFINIAKNIITKPMNEMPGPTAVRIVLKMSGLNVSSVVAPPPISKNPMTINATDTPMRMKFSFPSGRVSVFFSFFISSIFISVVFLSFEQVVVVEVDVFVGGKERRNAANHHSGKRQPDKYGGNFQLVEHSAHKSADDVLRREV